MRSSKNKNPCFDCLASEKENEEVCRTIRAILNKHNSVQVDLNDPGSIGTLTIGDCTFNVYTGYEYHRGFFTEMSKRHNRIIKRSGNSIMRYSGRNIVWRHF